MAHDQHTSILWLPESVVHSKGGRVGWHCMRQCARVSVCSMLTVQNSFVPDTTNMVDDKVVKHMSDLHLSKESRTDHAVQEQDIPKRHGACCLGRNVLL